MGVKITELPESLLPVPSDELASVNSGITKRVSIDRITKTAVSAGNVVHVAKSGSDATGDGTPHNPFLTIKAAFDSFDDETQDNSYLVMVGPGEYVEDNPITVRQWLNLVSVGGGGPTNIEAANPGSPILTLDPFTVVTGFHVIGATTSDALSITGSGGGIIVLEDMWCRDCDRMLHVNNPNIRVDIRDMTARYEVSPYSDIWAIEAGAVVFHTATVYPGTPATNILHGYGANVNIGARGIAIGPSTGPALITNAYNMEDGAQMELQTTRVDAVENVLVVDTGGIIHCGGIYTHGTTGFDIKQMGTGEILVVTGEMHIEKISAEDYTKVRLLFSDDTPSDEALVVVQELSVGLPEFGRETAIGEGDSTTRGMLVYKFTASGSVWEDVSTEMASPSGSQVDFGGAADDAMYVSWDLEDSLGEKLKWFGVKIDIVTPQNAPLGDIAFEYWDGLAWSPLRLMSTQANAPYAQYPLDAVPAGSSQVRLDMQTLRANWAKNDPPTTGTGTRFWARRRIVNPQGGPFTVERIKMHTNRAEINGDGWVEYYGTARPIGNLPWTIDSSHPGSSSPGDQDVYLSKGLDAGKTENAFANNATDRVAFNFVAPPEMDLSGQITFDVYYIVTSGGGDVRFVFRWAVSKTGDSVYRTSGAAPATAPGEQELVIIDAAPGSVDEQGHFRFTIDVPLMISRYPDGTTPPDLMWMSLEREGPHALDTNTGTVAVISASGTMLKWCDGGHVF